MNPIHRLRGLAALAPLAAALAGCSAGPPSPADPSAARSTLERSLAAWKEGRAAEELGGESPSVVVSDYRWRNGYRLEKFMIDPSATPNGADLRVRVTLDQRDPKGKPVRETAVYVVGTGSPHTVVREDGL